jgi:sugar/nucleoside kinase (ribokinase family)
MLDLLATGYPSLDYIIPVSHSPKVGETALIGDVPADHEAAFGGCGANVAAALSTLGFQAAIATIVGDDREGFLYTSQMRKLGINTQDIITVRQSKTSRSYLFRNPDGEYQNFFFAGAADEWKGILRLMNLRRIQYALLTVGPYHYNKQFAKLVREADKSLIWQLKPDISAFTQEAMRSFAESSEYILMNHIEADFVKEGLKLNKLDELLSDTTKAVIVTEGEKGCTVYDKDGRCDVKAVTPGELVDSTGAGDGFTAGFIGGLIQGKDHKTCAQMGSVMASYILENIGCQTNLPSWRNFEGRYQSHFGEL